jgi:hypothetical protein
MPLSQAVRRKESNSAHPFSQLAPRCFVKSTSAPTELDRPTRALRRRAGQPKMRPADFCNPHFKDEHPETVWPPLCAEASSAPRVGWRFTTLNPFRPTALRLVGCCLPELAGDQPSLWRSVALRITTPRLAAAPRVRTSQDRFRRRPVKGAAFHDPERLPSPRSSLEPFADPVTRSVSVQLSSPFRSLRFPALS